MKQTLIIGSSGYVGRCVTNMLINNSNIIYTHNKRAYFKNSIKYDLFRDDIKSILQNYNISTIIFTSFVENSESNQLNLAMEHFIKNIKNYRFIYLSSDAIFDGKKGLYTEKDKPTPTTHYGKNLKLCEDLIQKYCSNYCIIRPSYIYGFLDDKLDNRLLQTKNNLLNGKIVKLFDNMYKSPLGLKQVSKAIITLSNLNYSGIVHVAGERLSVYEFHYRAMKSLGIDTTKLIKESMPLNSTYLQDTSLDSNKWKNLTNMKALNIEETLKNN